MAANPRVAAASRKRAAIRPPTGPVEVGAFEPIHIAADPVDEERVPIFYIGDDEYTVPKIIPPGVALEYLRIAGEKGDQYAAPIIMTRVLGEEAYTALEQSRGITSDQLEHVVKTVIDLALGRTEKEGKVGRR